MLRQKLARITLKMPDFTEEYKDKEKATEHLKSVNPASARKQPRLAIRASTPDD